MIGTAVAAAAAAAAHRCALQHCPFPLYNNLLWANWQHPWRLMMLGKSNRPQLLQLPSVCVGLLIAASILTGLAPLLPICMRHRQ